MVRNLDSGDKEQDRDVVEALFLAESNFRTLPGASLGIAHLRQRLSPVLFGQIKAEFPQLIKDIEVGISSYQQGLDKLGPARVTLDDQKNFLVDLSDDFQSLCDAATKGDLAQVLRGTVSRPTSVSHDCEPWNRIRGRNPNEGGIVEDRR